MERSFSVGAPDTGNTIKLFTLDSAARRHQRPREPRRTSAHRAGEEDAAPQPRHLGIPLDNVEGMTFGPRLADGRRTLLLVSDNNFAPAQFTQFLLFAFSGTDPS